MKSLLVALLCLAVVGQIFGSNSHEWNLFKRQHHKRYSSLEEEARRFAIYMNTKAKIELHNANESNSYKLGLNHMADWHPEEKAKLHGLRYDAKLLDRELSSEDEAYLNKIINTDTPIPDEVDWRKVPGRVGPVKDQGMCGSCWAFATTGMLEGQQLVRNVTSQLVTLSEQELVDCSKTNLGCGGGLMEYALNDIKKLGGVESECDYPYEADGDECTIDKSLAVMTDSGAIVLKKGDEVTLKKLVATYGPVSTAMYASDVFHDYQSGIFDDCINEPQLTHAVLIVGYGTDPKKGDFWIGKNCWSESWGENGYFRIKRGSNMCSIATIPTIAKF